MFPRIKNITLLCIPIHKVYIDVTYLTLEFKRQWPRYVPYVEKNVSKTCMQHSKNASFYQIGYR